MIDADGDNLAFSIFTNTIITPDCLPIDFGYKHIKFNGYMDEIRILPNIVKYTTNFTPILVMINAQNFTKTSAAWGIDNNKKGTNTNRIVVFKK